MPTIPQDGLQSGEPLARDFEPLSHLLSIQWPDLDRTIHR
jgi:hypothetical protein